MFDLYSRWRHVLTSRPVIFSTWSVLKFSIAAIAKISISLYMYLYERIHVLSHPSAFLNLHVHVAFASSRKHIGVARTFLSQVAMNQTKRCSSVGTRTG